MSSHYQLSIFTQISDQPQVDEGVHAIQDYVIGISHEPVLLVMARSNADAESSTAFRAVDILIDDMETNLSATQTGFGKISPDTFVTQCVRESLDNINEFLHFQLSKSQMSTQDAHTSIAAIQYFEGYFGYIVMVGFSCLLFRENELTALSQVSEESSYLLGETPVSDWQVNSIPVRQGDILVMAQISDIEAIGIDYLRMTLSRFPDSIDMALRQMKTRASRNAASCEPGILIARVDELVVKKRGWLNKLRCR